jgi:hypothetical protein
MMTPVEFAAKVYNHWVPALIWIKPIRWVKRASASRSSGQWQDEDYDVLADGKVVGRIYEGGSVSTSPELLADSPRWSASASR